MMSNMCGTAMMLVGGLATVLGLALVGSLIALIWVVIARLRADARASVRG